MTYFFWLHVHGLRGTRRAQIFFYVPYEPQASIGKTHGRNSLAPAARTFSHFLSLTLTDYYFYHALFRERFSSFFEERTRYAYAAPRTGHRHRARGRLYSDQTDDRPERDETLFEVLVTLERHPGELVAKVGYFGVKSAKVYRVQMGTKPAKVGRLGPRCAKVRLKCGAASTPHRRAPPQKGLLDPRREQSC